MNSRAYSEVYQVIQYLSESEYKLIPSEQIEFIKKNMDRNMEKICTINTRIEDLKLSDEAKTILFTLFYMNIATTEQREKINQILLAEDKKQSEEMTSNMFKNNIKKISEGINSEENKNTDLIVINERNVFTRIKYFFIKLLKKHKEKN